MTAQLADTETGAAQTFDLTNPVNGEVVATFPVHTPEQVTAVVAKAREAQAWWDGLGFDGRKRRMNRWTSYLAKHIDEICELGNRETAKPPGDVLFELLASLEDIKWAAANAERVLKERKVSPGLAMINFEARVGYRPLGVAGIIAPWNAPLYTVLCGLAYALAAGNAAVVKPSEFSAATGVYAVESFFRANPDAPAGLVAWVSGFGDTGAALCTSGVDKLAFTGSVATGRRVMQACARTLTPVLLELGGKAPFVVLDDANLDEAVAAAAFGAFMNQGQICMSTERIVVDQKVADVFVERLARKATTLVAGDPRQALTPLGLVIDRDAVERIDGLIKDAV